MSIFHRMKIGYSLNPGERRVILDTTCLIKLLNDIIVLPVLLNEINFNVRVCPSRNYPFINPSLFTLFTHLK